MPQERAEKRIDELPVLSEVTGTERLPIEDGGVAKSVTVETLLAGVTTGQGLTEEIKTALLTIAQKVAYIDANGQTYYDALYAALYPPANLMSISAVFSQSDHIIYDSDSLDVLKPFLSVTARYDDGSNQPVTNYVLSGSLTEGTSTITVSYGGKSTTFDVIVTHAVQQYTITNNLTETTNSNNAERINEETAYSATLTANEGYILSTVTVTMGGTDITATAYDSGTITIASVVGDIVITAVAVEDVGWIADVPYDITWIDNKDLVNSTGEETDSSNMSVSDFLPCSGLRAFVAENAYKGWAFFYDENKTFLGRNTGSIDWNMEPATSPVRYDAKYFRVVKRPSSICVITPKVFPVLGQGVVPSANTKYNLDMIFGKTVWNSTGKETENANSKCSDFALCYGFSTIAFSHKVRAWVGFYDANKTFLSNTLLSATVTTANVPDGATYFRYDASGYMAEWPYVTLTE